MQDFIDILLKITCEYCFSMSYERNLRRLEALLNQALSDEDRLQRSSESESKNDFIPDNFEPDQIPNSKSEEDPMVVFHAMLNSVDKQSGDTYS